MGNLLASKMYRFHCGEHQDKDCIVNRCDLSSEMVNGSGWRTQLHKLEIGQARFLSADIANGISITHSCCSFHQDFHSEILYDSPVAILGFGLQGASNYWSGGDKHRQGLLRPNDIWLYRPVEGKMVRHTAPQTKNQGVALKFEGERITALLDEIRDEGGDLLGEDVGAVRLNGSLDVRQILQPLLDNPLVGAMDKLIAESTALTLLATALETLPSRSGFTENQVCNQEEKSVFRVMELLSSDLSSPPDLYRLAAEAGMSHTRLNRCFKKVSGLTVFAWLRKHRLEVACKLLHQDLQTITEIAFYCGFSSSSHFGACFRAKFGCTPQEYRCRGHV